MRKPVVVKNLRPAKEISTAGTIFEIGFKIGLAREMENKKSKTSQEWHNALNHIINTVKENENKTGILAEFFKNTEKVWNMNFISGRSGDNRKTIEKKPELFLYATGIYEGMFFAKFSLTGEAHPVILDLFAETPEAGVYQNADIILKEESTLHLYDLKLFGGLSHAQKMLMDKKNSNDVFMVPPKVRGKQLSLAMGNTTLEEFTEALLQAGNIATESGEYDLDPELKSLIQIFSYFYDYLYRNPEEEIKTVKLGVIHATTDSLLYTFNVSKNINAKHYAEQFKKIYENWKKKTAVFMEIVENVPGESDNKAKFMLYKLRLDRIKQNLLSLKQQLLRDISERNRGKFTQRIKPEMSMDKLRESVRNVTREFWNSNPFGKVLMLLHSTGAGKTTSAREVILRNAEQKLIYFYFAPRKSLVEEEASLSAQISDVEVLLAEKVKNEKIAQQKQKYLKKGEEVMEDNDHISYLSVVARQINKEVATNKKKIACFLTTHTITKTVFHGKQLSTLRHLWDWIHLWIKSGYKIAIVIDELTGSSNGFWAVQEITKKMSNDELVKQNTTLLVFDATLHSRSIFQNAWEEFAEQKLIAPSFIFAKNEANGELQINGIPVCVYSGYSYPAKEVIIREKFVFPPENAGLGEQDFYEAMYDEIANIIEKELYPLKQRGERLYVYIQNRPAVMRIYQKLEQRGIKAIVSTSNIKSTVEKLKNKAELEEDIVISTSTLSRGISLSQNFTKAIIITTHFAGVESNIAEDIQACARIRGMKNDGETVKEIVRVYVPYLLENRTTLQEVTSSTIEHLIEETGQSDIQEVQDEIQELLFQMREVTLLQDIQTFADIMLAVHESYINPDRRKEIVATLPAQIEPVYIHEHLSAVESYYAFLDEVAHYGPLTSSTGKLVEKKEIEDLRDAIKGIILTFLHTNISDAVFPGTGQSRIIDFISPYLYVRACVKTRQNKEALEKARQLFVKYRDYLMEQNRDKTREMERWIDKLIDEQIELPCVIYIPLLVLGYEIADDNFLSIDFLIQKSITRAYINVIGGDLGLTGSVRTSSLSQKGVFIPLIPVQGIEGISWLKGTYPRVSGLLIKQLADSKVKCGNT